MNQGSILHNPPHWNYYLKLERDLEETFQYVAPVQEHFSVFSPEFARILLVAATEVENALGSLARASSVTKRPERLADHCSHVSAKYPKFTTIEFSVPRYEMHVHPWRDWSPTTAPDWWRNGYNKVKHDRLGHPAAATLLRAVEAVAALQAVLLYLYRASHPHIPIAGDRTTGLIVPVQPEDPLTWGNGGWSCALPDDAPYMPENWSRKV